MDKDLILGIDIGGTNTAFGVVDRYGNILTRGKISTSVFSSFDDFVSALKHAVVDAMSAERLELESIYAIGVGAPCVNYSSGEIVGAVDLPWPSPIPLTATLSREFGAPAYADNDANAAALGEMRYGAGRGLTDVIVITLGTGVGSAIICDGHLLHGNRGLAGELGHVTIYPYSERECSCGRRGCLETYASARGVVATANKILTLSGSPSLLSDKSPLTTKRIAEAAAMGDSIALKVWEETGRVIGKACAEFAAFSSPEAFIFFGGVAKAFSYFEKSIRKSFEDNLLWIYKNSDIRFLTSSLPEADAAILGAAALVS